MNQDMHQEILDFPFTGKEYSDLSQHDIRILILYLLYVLSINDYDVSLPSVADSIRLGFDFNIPTDSYAFQTAQSISNKRLDLDKVIEPLLKNWKMERLGACTKIILEIAVWEIKYSENPTSVIINEAVELAKAFSEKDAYKFINGVLDQISKSSS